MASLLLLLLLLSSLLFKAAASANRSRCFPALFIFGDSYLDVGNKAALQPQAFQQAGSLPVVSNEPPYGQTFFKQPTGRFSDGRMISDFLQSVGSSFKNGVNFAIGGGTAIESSYYASRNISISAHFSLLDELGWFLRFKKQVECVCNACFRFCLPSSQEQAFRLPKSSAAFSKGLYIVGEIGSNDYSVGVFDEGMSSAQLKSVVLPLVIQAIAKFFKALYSSGARRFLFIGLPPMVDGPGYRSFGTLIDRDGLYNLTSAHNTMLRDLVKELRAAYTDAFIAFADFQGIHKEIMDHPEKYGFNDTSSACCGAQGPFNFNISTACGQPGYILCDEPSKFVYWDFSHFTEHYARVVTEAFLSGKYLDPPRALKRKCIRKK